jgi:hypothetical protein
VTSEGSNIASFTYGAKFSWAGNAWAIHDCETPEEAHKRLSEVLATDRMEGKMSLWHWLRFGYQLRRCGKALDERRCR